MPSVQKFAVLGLAALVVCAVVASAVSAATLVKTDGTPYTGNVTAANVGNVTLNTNWVGAISCTSSTITGNFSVSSPPLGSFTGATWSGGGSGTNCTTNVADCTATAENLPWNVTAAVGTMTVSDPFYVGMDFTCLGTTCTFGASSVDLTLNNGTPATDMVAIAHVTMTLESGNIFQCGTHATWSADYTIWGNGSFGSHIHLMVV